MNPTGTKSMFAEVNEVANVIGLLMIAKAILKECLDASDDSDDSVRMPKVEKNLATSVIDDLDKPLAMYLEIGVEKVHEITEKYYVEADTTPPPSDNTPKT